MLSSDARFDLIRSSWKSERIIVISIKYEEWNDDVRQVRVYIQWANNANFIEKETH